MSTFDTIQFYKFSYGGLRWPTYFVLLLGVIQDYRSAFDTSDFVNSAIVDPFLFIQLGVFHVMLVLCRFFSLDTKKLAKSLYKERIISAVEIASSVSLFFAKKRNSTCSYSKGCQRGQLFRQGFFKEGQEDMFATDNSFMYGRSVSNQRIEAWWSILRKMNTDFWINNLRI